MRAPSRSNTKVPSSNEAPRNAPPIQPPALVDLRAAALPQHSTAEKPQSTGGSSDQRQQGPTDPRAFDFNRWYGEFDGYVRALVRASIRDHQWAEDVTQAVWQRLAVAGHRYDPSRAKEVTFIGVVTKRVIIDALRRHQHRTQHLDPSYDDLDQRPQRSVVSGHSVPEQVSNQELGKIAVSLVESMGPKRQKVLESIYLRGMNFSEVSKAFGMPLGTVKSLVSRSLRKLRDELSRERIKR